MSKKGNITRTTTLSKGDVDFLYHVMEDHMNIVDSHHGCAWNDSMEEEKKQANKIKSVLPAKLSAPSVPIPPEALSPTDFWYLDFTLLEWSDFVNEGVGSSWFKKPQYNSIRAKSILTRLRELVGISPEEYERGLAL